MTDALVRRWGVERVRAAAIVAGGAAGTLARAAVAEALPHSPGEWPWALLAWWTTRLAEMIAPTRFWRFLLGTGVCGAFTTFSTFQVETIRLARDGGVALAAGYAAASLAAGMALAVAATVLARRHRYG